MTPLGTVTPASDKFFGRVLVTVTPVARNGPRFVTFRVRVTVWPTRIVPGAPGEPARNDHEKEKGDEDERPDPPVLRKDAGLLGEEGHRFFRLREPVPLRPVGPAAWMEDARRCAARRASS